MREMKHERNELRRTFLISLTAVAWSLFSSVAAADELSGTWSGPWYRGMTSGTMTLEIDATNEKAQVRFTNLENFGDDAVPVSKLEIAQKTMKFSAASAGTAVFVASSKLAGGGKMLKGTAEYEGFRIEFKLKRKSN
jgi:hypothetical protein